jgi:hypothetical protein
MTSLTSIRLPPPSARAAGPSTRPGSAGRPAAPAPRAAARLRPNQMASRSAPAWRTRSFRCFSPTRRCCSTSTSSQNTGASKPWPQTWASSSGHGLGVEPLAGQRAVGAQRALSAWRHPATRPPPAAARLSQRPCRSGLVDGAAGGHRMAAEAQQHAGVALATRSSASRRWKPGIERPEPLSGRPAPRAKTKVGRCSRSFRRPATMPTTPFVEASGSNSASAGGRLAGRAAALQQWPRPARACRPRPRGARG